MNIEAYNRVFLMTHPDIARKLKRRIRRPKVIVMALKPKYAKAIYDGKKNWEFRKAPPPLYQWIYIYESAPVSAVTGRVMFTESVTGVPILVMDIVSRCRAYTVNHAGISLEELKTYAGKKLVTALRVYQAERFDKPIPFNAKPPQNWGRFAYVPKQDATEKSDSV